MRPPDRPKPNPPAPKPIKPEHNLLHYASYFFCVGGLVFIAQADEPNPIKDALLSGAIASGAVVSRDWYKARLNPNLAADPNALIQLFSEMLHAGRAQANTNAAHLKRVELLNVDLISAMREFNDMLRLTPAEIEAKLRTVQTAQLTSALSTVKPPASTNGFSPPPLEGDTHRPDGTTVRQSFPHQRPGFDA
ncbi:MAG: hypothetical protein AAFR58_07470 [Cyanobacteria bacterium J06627_28]